MKKLVVAAGIVAGFAFGPSADAQTKPTVPVIVKDMTSPHWQAVLAGARKAGQDLGVNVVELGAQSENDVNGQISILETAVASNPAAIVIAPHNLPRSESRLMKPPRESRSSASNLRPTPRL